MRFMNPLPRGLPAGAPWPKATSCAPKEVPLGGAPKEVPWGGGAQGLPPVVGAKARLGAGLGLRGPHVADVLAAKPPVGWWEVHSENYFGGGEPITALERVRERYALSLHGVGMGL